MGWKEDRSKKYLEKLRDPRWQQIRLRVFERDNWKCLICGASDETLCVHHRRYVRGREPWEYELGDLAALCWTCHKGEHEQREEATSVLIEALTVHGGYFYDDFWCLAGFFSRLKRIDDFVWKLECNVNREDTRQEFIDFINRLFIRKPPDAEA